MAKYVQQEYRPTIAELDRLREILRQGDQIELQRGVLGWFLRENPTTGQDRGSFDYPNRSTPRTVQILLDWSEANAKFAEKEIAKFDAAGLPFVPIGDVGQAELRSDLANFRAELEGWKAENARAIRDFPDLEGADLRWREQVFGPVLFGLYPDGRDTYAQFLQGRIIADLAGIGAASLDETSDQFWIDLKEAFRRAAKKAAVGSSSLLAFAAIGIIGAILITRNP